MNGDTLRQSESLSPPKLVNAKKLKKKKSKKKMKESNILPYPKPQRTDQYRPSPILDDFSAHSEGRLPKLDRKFYEKELTILQV